jgi:hypothetical protein
MASLRMPEGKEQAFRMLPGEWSMDHDVVLRVEKNRGQPE